MKKMNYDHTVSGSHWLPSGNVDSHFLPILRKKLAAQRERTQATREERGKKHQ